MNIYMSVAIERGRGGQFRAGKEDVLQRNNGPIVGGNTRNNQLQRNYMKLCVRDTVRTFSVWLRLKVVRV